MKLRLVIFVGIAVLVGVSLINYQDRSTSKPWENSYCKTLRMEDPGPSASWKKIKSYRWELSHYDCAPNL